MDVSWNWFVKRHWKKILILVFLATVSTISFLLLVRNSAEKVYSLLNPGPGTQDSQYLFYSFGSKTLLNFGEDWKTYLLFVIVFVIVSCFLTAFAYYYRNYLTNLVSNDLKQKSINKLYRLEEQTVQGKEKFFFAVIYHHAKKLGDYFVFLTDNLYIFGLTTILLFLELKTVSGESIWAGLVYFFIVSLLSFVFNYLINRRETELQKVLEKQTEAESNLINNRKLIIKKGLTNHHFKDYQQISRAVQKKANQETFFSSLYKSIFAYVIRFGKFFLLLILLVFVPNANDFVVFAMFAKLTTSFNYLMKGVRKYPSYTATQKRFNYFLNLPERNDIQKNVLVREHISRISLQKVSFSYKRNKTVLQELNLTFQRGKINYLQAPNGFGKTTIVGLIFGLYQPSEGVININGKYRLNELNLKEWRKKISYAESSNLVKSSLSLGQKQLIDLKTTIEKDSEIYIFDEAENNLDMKNKEIVDKKMKTLAKKKIVIIIKAN